MNDSAPNGEPLRMTLAEALVYLARNREGQRIDDPDYDVGIRALPDGKWLGYTHLNSGIFDTWTEAFAEVLELRVPVVERDDTAELVEALLEWAEAKRKYDDGHYDSEDDWSGVRPSHDEAYRRLERAEAKLTTLGALHHAEAALAKRKEHS